MRLPLASKIQTFWSSTGGPLLEHPDAVAASATTVAAAAAARERRAASARSRRCCAASRTWTPTTSTAAVRVETSSAVAAIRARSEAGPHRHR